MSSKISIDTELVLQTTFASLAMSNREFFRPHGFWKAFKDYDGEPLNLREHQDAYEFFTRLQVCTDAPVHRAISHFL